MKRSRNNDEIKNVIKKDEKKKDEKKQRSGRKYWLAVAHKDHVLEGKSSNFIMVCHGKEAPLLKMSPGDVLVYYSPREFTKEKSTKTFMSFTAIARVGSASMEKNELNMSKRPAQFLDTQDAKIEPITLSWKPKEGSKWGMAIRSGFKELTKEDFTIIAQAMKLNEDLI